ncbi:hypothetical protein ASE03_16890 [Kitasatospora sp. Root187]|nr:hypothetical protein ASE03_16890 [Kitasatospora sp. Root187]
MASAHRPPSTTTATPTQTAGCRPSAKPAGEAIVPWAVKTLLSTAMPSAPPISRTVVLAPEALPRCSGPTAPSTTAAVGAIAKPIPAPATSIPPTNWEYGVSAEATRLIQDRPTAWRKRPSAISRPPPTRSVSAPAIGAITIGIRVQDSVSTPACSGVRGGAICRYWARKKIEPKTPKYIEAETMLVSVNALTR